MVLLAAALAASCASAPSVAASSETAAFSLGSSYGERQAIVFNVPAAGKIRARAEWKGKSSGLALILNGPGKTGYYKRVDGLPPLALSQIVTPEILALGTEWKISIICWDENTKVEGTLFVEYPK
jgi:hypothetical protein